MKTEIEKLIEWIREPDHAEQFTLSDITDWMNRRPIATAMKLQAEIAKIERPDESTASDDIDPTHNDQKQHRNKETKADVRVGQVFRDTYYDKKDNTKTMRTIRIIEVLENNVRAEVLTDLDGQTLKKPRSTKVSFKTLRAGYVATAQS